MNTICYTKALNTHIAKNPISSVDHMLNHSVWKAMQQAGAQTSCSSFLSFEKTTS